MNDNSIVQNSIKQKFLNQKSLNLSIYIHIPFCKQKCGYCDFASQPFEGQDSKILENYFKSIAQELSIYHKILQNSQIDQQHRNINTIYFGGGTPSLISPDYIAQTLNHIRDFGIINDNPEITLEANPESLTEAKLQEYKKIGINRISLGIQSSNDQTLKQLGRLHTFDQAKKIHQLAQNLGFNTSIDLIYGLPNQTSEDLKDDLENFLQLNPNHISAYALALEPEVPLYKIWHEKMQDGSHNESTDDKQAQFYHLISQTLENNGYQNYEISNWSKPDFESQHNSNYWNTVPNQGNWLGLGVSAYSSINFPSNLNPNSHPQFFRWNNPSSLESYEKYISELYQKISNQKKSDLTFQNLNNIEELSLSQRLNEKIMLGLRTKKGLNLNSKAGNNSVSDLELLEQLHDKKIEQILEPIKDLINFDESIGTITVTAENRFITDSIIRELLI